MQFKIQHKVGSILLGLLYNFMSSRLWCPLVEFHKGKYSTCRFQFMIHIVHIYGQELKIL